MRIIDSTDWAALLFQEAGALLAAGAVPVAAATDFDVEVFSRSHADQRRLVAGLEKVAFQPVSQ